jgi:hypothetical protein
VSNLRRGLRVSLHMRTTITTMVLGLALLAPAGALASNDKGADNAAQTCKTERAAIGTTAFRDLYGTNKTKSNAFGKCVSKAKKADDAAAKNASKACKAEEAADPAAFAAKYGTGKQGKNAFGKCVSQTAKADREAEQTEKVNAAKQCKAERKADEAAFEAAYGSGRNAFGKCVSKAAQAD